MLTNAERLDEALSCERHLEAEKLLVVRQQERRLLKKAIAAAEDSDDEGDENIEKIAILTSEIRRLKQNLADDGRSSETAKAHRG
eukprot:TRINITY_DN4567_c0_g1_i1.p1 TRINITY_DN4567_c0_g1~~TRINITY_DN4567_c0_g1_i1.p1  ORF type:complete len:98 (+),score=56.98 TRINITY_DN4567_c0_g1_i1:41-295(+)